MIDRVSLRRPTRRERPTSPLRRVRDIVSWIRDPTSRAPIAVGFARLIHLTARHTPRGVCGIGVVNHPVRVHAAAFYANEYLDFPIKGRIGRAARNDQPFVAVHLLRPLSLASTGQRVDEEIGRGAKITAKRRRLLPSLARPRIGLDLAAQGMNERMQGLAIAPGIGAPEDGEDIAVGRHLTRLPRKRRLYVFLMPRGRVQNGFLAPM